jgi:glycosyltransferase involved in cell wall biosynthesis
LEDHEIREQYRNCRAFLFPGEEDFGITPVEAQSHGRPVIAYGRGGVLETVNGIDVWETPDGAATGVFFREQSCDALCGAMLAFERWESRFLAENIRGSVQRFSPLIFKERMMQYVSRNWEEFSLNRAEQALSPPEVMPQ